MNRRYIVLAALWIFGVQLAITELACGQTEKEEAKDSAPVDPAGTWKWTYERDGNTAEFKVNLDWDGKELTGKYTGFDRTTDIDEAKFEKDQISFTTKREFEGREFIVEFDGKVKPDEIDGTVKVEFGGEPREFDWNAKRVVETDDVVGAWQLRVETAGGVVEPKLTISKDGDQLKGTSESRLFGVVEAKNLKLDVNTLTWEVSGQNSDFTIHVKYVGKPRGNTMEGTSELSAGNNSGAMKFTGKRTPPDDDEKERASKDKAAEDRTTERAPADESTGTPPATSPE